MKPLALALFLTFPASLPAHPLAPTHTDKGVL